MDYGRTYEDEIRGALTVGELINDLKKLDPDMVVANNFQEVENNIDITFYQLAWAAPKVEKIKKKREMFHGMSLFISKDAEEYDGNNNPEIEVLAL